MFSGGAVEHQGVPTDPAAMGGAHAVVGEGGHAADESADSHGEDLSQEDSNHGGPPHWEYGGGPGQRLWGELSAEFTACVDGSAQSLINVANAIPTPLRNIDFNYQAAQLNIINNGHTIQGSYGQQD